MNSFLVDLLLKYEHFKVECDKINDLPEVSFEVGDTMLNINKNDYIIKVCIFSINFYRYLQYAFLLICQTINILVRGPIWNQAMCIWFCWS